MEYNEWTYIQAQLLRPRRCTACTWALEEVHTLPTAATFADLVGGVLFYFARLFAESVEFREYIRPTAL